MSYPIIFKQQLSEQVFALRVQAPQIAAGALPGQFAILRINEEGERFPLTLADWSAEEGWIFLVFQVVGKSTFTLSKLEVGDELKDVVGPLGLPSEIEKYGRVICVGGGIGIAALYPIARALRPAGNRVDSIIGARSQELLILEKEMEEVSNSLTIMTDDGSKGTKGLVTWAMENELKGEGADLVLAIGPAIMMKFASAVTAPFKVPTRVSLNSIMLDGTGMCGTCRVEVCGKTRFACVEGPEFDGNEVDWNLLLNRLGQYKPEEALSYEQARTGCCQA